MMWFNSSLASEPRILGRSESILLWNSRHRCFLEVAASSGFLGLAPVILGITFVPSSVFGVQFWDTRNPDSEHWGFDMVFRLFRQIVHHFPITFECQITQSIWGKLVRFEAFGCIWVKEPWWSGCGGPRPLLSYAAIREGNRFRGRIGDSCCVAQPWVHRMDLHQALRSRPLLRILLVSAGCSAIGRFWDVGAPCVGSRVAILLINPIGRLAIRVRLFLTEWFSWRSTTRSLGLGAF